MVIIFLSRLFINTLHNIYTNYTRPLLLCGDHSFTLNYGVIIDVFFY